MYPWEGEFGTTMAINPITGEPISQQAMLSADGGIINAYNNGGDVQHFQAGAGPFGVYYPEGDTDYDASQVINEPGVVDPTEDLDLFMGDDMAANELADQEGVMQVAGLNEMLTVYDKVEQRVVTITRAKFARNPGRYSMAPPTEIGAGVMGAGAGAAANEFFAGAAEQTQLLNAILEENDPEQQQFLIRRFEMMGGQLPEGFMDKTGNVYSRDQEFLDREGITQIGELERPPSLGAATGISEDMLEKAKQLAIAIKVSGRLNDDDILRALKMIQEGDMSKINEAIEEAKERRRFMSQYYEERGPRTGEFKEGGIAYLAEGSFPRKTGAIAGPGGPKDDRVPAMLSDGEFVMTAKAVRNAGGGSRRQGAKKMYQLMNRLEGTA